MRARLVNFAVASWIRRGIFGLLIVVAFISVTAASAPDSTETAVTIATFVLMIASPFLGLAQLHLKDSQIVIASLLLALIVALAAQFFTGELTSATWGSFGALLLEFTKLWAIQQAVFQLFKDSPVLGPKLTTAPLLSSSTAPAPPA